MEVGRASVRGAEKGAVATLFRLLSPLSISLMVGVVWL